MAATWEKLAFEEDSILKSVLTERGSIIYASGIATEAELKHGSAGQVLKSGGHAANPSWTTPMAGADYILQAYFAAVGDLITATANDTPALLGVGTDDYVLTANSGVANGIEWAAFVAGAHKLNDHTAADGVVDFGAKQMHDVKLDTYAQEAVELAAVGAVGQIAWATDTLHPYLCVSVA